MLQEHELQDQDQDQLLQSDQTTSLPLQQLTKVLQVTAPEGLDCHTLKCLDPLPSQRGRRQIIQKPVGKVQPHTFCTLLFIGTTFDFQILEGFV